MVLMGLTLEKERGLYNNLSLSVVEGYPALWSVNGNRKDKLIHWLSGYVFKSFLIILLFGHHALIVSSKVV